MKMRFEGIQDLVPDTLVQRGRHVHCMTCMI
jgi:hypothetical protein